LTHRERRTGEIKAMTTSNLTAETAVARQLLAGRFAPTTLRRSDPLTRQVGVESYLKLEQELPTGSFKVRGAFHALWRRQQRAAVDEVVAASTGNHGAAVAWAARELGVIARVFVPVGANVAKIARIRAMGAHLREIGADIEGARRAAESYVAETGAFLLDDATNADVPTGAGTIALELLEQRPEHGTVVVPVGDSALIRGVAAVLKAARPDVRIVGVQASGAPAYYESWRSGRVVTTETADTIADGLATTTPTEHNVSVIRALVDEMVLVSEDEMLGAMRWLLAAESVTAEPAAAASVAALLRSTRTAPPPWPGPIIALVTGGNVAPEVLDRVTAVPSDRRSVSRSTRPWG
jgi:threonine dehydratase